LTLRAALSNSAATIKPQQEFLGAIKAEQTAQTCDIA
jgi:hypothetical protein